MDRSRPDCESRRGWPAPADPCPSPAASACAPGESVEARLGHAVLVGERARNRLAAGGCGDRDVVRLEALVTEGQRAAARLVESKLGLAEAVARRFRTRRMSHLDLVQEGTIGLIRAVQRFDPRRGPLAPYATWWIREAITTAIADRGRTIRLPVRVARSVALVRSTEADLEAQWGRTPTIAEVASVLGSTPDRSRRTAAYGAEPLSLSRAVSGDGDGTLSDMVEDPSAPSPVQQVELSLLPKTVAPLLVRLDDRERLVVQLRFGLDGVPAHTLAEIGAVLGLTRQRVGQIEARAMTKLRRSPSTAAAVRELLTG
jgi:RNA polymerase primary sigma factor